jgi:hypothetical protein
MVVDTGAAPSSALPGQGAIDWGVRWRTGTVSAESGKPVVVLLGIQQSFPADIVASNRGAADIDLAPANVGLSIAVRSRDGDVPVVLQCEERQDYHEVENGSTVRSASVTYARLTLKPEDSVEARCAIVRTDGGTFALGSYRVLVNVQSWTQARSLSAWWDVDVREPRNPGERKTQHVTAGSELLRQGSTAAAVTQFERAVALDSRDPQAVLSLAGAYERLERYAESARLLEALQSSGAARGRMDPVVLARRAAANYVRSGDERSARRVLKSAKVEDAAIDRFVSEVRKRK